MNPPPDIPPKRRTPLAIIGDFVATPHYKGLHQELADTLATVQSLQRRLLEPFPDDDARTRCLIKLGYMRSHHKKVRRFLGALNKFLEQIRQSHLASERLAHHQQSEQALLDRREEKRLAHEKLMREQQEAKQTRVRRMHLCFHNRVREMLGDETYTALMAGVRRHVLGMEGVRAELRRQAAMNTTKLTIAEIAELQPTEVSYAREHGVLLGGIEAAGDIDHEALIAKCAAYFGPEASLHGEGIDGDDCVHYAVIHPAAPLNNQNPTI